MTLEGEYYPPNWPARLWRGCRNPHDIGRRILRASSLRRCFCRRVAILMTLEGEYYYRVNSRPLWRYHVAILMTLEGEYYSSFCAPKLKSIIVAILMTLEGEYYQALRGLGKNDNSVAILMTLEGEYYSTSCAKHISRNKSQSSWHWKANITYSNNSVGELFEGCRNPHDIGRRILLQNDLANQFLGNVSQSSWHWKANITSKFRGG